MPARPPVMPLLLTDSDVRAVLPMADLIETMERALSQFSGGEVDQPVRTVMEVGASTSFFGVMPARLTDPAALGTKLVGVFPGNITRGLATHQATIVLFDPESGVLRAVLDGRYITEARTAAVSAVSVRHLARNPGPVTVGLLGSGVQAGAHLEALRHVCRLESVRVWSPTAAHRRRVADEWQAGLGLPVHAVDNPETAIRGAGLVVLTTSATEPVVEDAWVGDGAHVVSVGACRPDHREMAPELVARGTLFVDSRAAALVESGDVVQGIAAGLFGPDQIRAELGEVVAGRAAGRSTPGEVTIFKSLGLAVEDVAAAHLAYTRAVARGLGTEVKV